MIYYVEDDDNIRGLTLYALRQQGIEAEGFASDSEFKAAVAVSYTHLDVYKRQIGDNVFVGADSVILPGVQLGGGVVSLVRDLLSAATSLRERLWQEFPLE